MRQFYQGCGGATKPEYFSEFKPGEYVAEEKWDGIWACGIVKDGKIEFWSRNDKLKTEGAIKEFSSHPLPLKNTIFIGELMAFQQNAKKKHIRFNVFDIIWYEGGNLAQYDLLTRRQWLTGLKIWNDYYCLTPQYTENFKKVYEDVIARGGEGIILKKISGKTPYRGNTRNPYWLKVKKEVRISYVINGFNLSDCQSWPGEIKSIQGALYKDGKLITVCNIGSMSGNDRKWFSGHKKESIGMVIECKGYEIFRSGAIRHPSLIGIREDVNPKDCNFSQVSRT